MNDTGAAILRKILAEPADDVVRLVYADWLEEQGQEAHAELIRLQIQDPHSTRQRQLELIRHLYENRPDGPSVGRPMLEIPPDLRQEDFTGAVYRRGFIDEIQLNQHVWPFHLLGYLEFNPLRRVTLIRHIHPSDPNVEIQSSLSQRGIEFRHPPFVYRYRIPVTSDLRWAVVIPSLSQLCGFINHACLPMPGRSPFPPRTVLVASIHFNELTGCDIELYYHPTGWERCPADLYEERDFFFLCCPDAELISDPRI